MNGVWLTEVVGRPLGRCTINPEVAGECLQARVGSMGTPVPPTWQGMGLTQPQAEA
jgi:hypothetical protein